jgi:phosphatidylglycerol:prolipoprotein diacylglycerol transferase
MHPVLWSSTIVGQPVEVQSYSAMILLAAIVCGVVFTALARRRGLTTRDVAGLIGATGLAFLGGARLVHVVATGGAPADLWMLGAGGFSVLGGALCAVVAGLATARARKIDPWATADAAAPAVGVGVAIARVGCTLGGCCFGLPYAGLGAIHFPMGSPAWAWQVAVGRIGPLSQALPVWPVEPAEALGVLALAALAWWLGRRANIVPGTAAIVFSAGYLCLRLSLSFVRAPGGPGIGLLFATWTALVVVAAGSLYLLPRKG